MSKVNKKKMYNTIYDKIIAIMSSLIKLFYEQLGSITPDRYTSNAQ